MKILFLMSQIPYPLDTGAKIRSFNLIKALSKTHDITLVTYGDEDAEEEKITVMRQFCKEVVVVANKRLLCPSTSLGTPFGRRTCGAPRNDGVVAMVAMTICAIKNLFSLKPYSIEKYTSREMIKYIQQVISNTPYDLIHCDSVQMSRNVLGFKHVPKVLTEHNIESQILKRCCENESNIFRKLYYYLQYKKLNKYEIAACKQFDRVIAVSEEDKQYLAKFIFAEKISVVPNGVDTEYFKPCHCEEAESRRSNHKKEIASAFAELLPRSALADKSLTSFARNDNPTKIAEADSLVFTGSMDWLPNIDAVLYFCKDMLPLVWKIRADTKFYIVGRNPSKKVINLGKADNRIIVTGAVDDVRPYIEKAQVFVVPLRIGGGTRLKILEAMSIGKPVISTSIGSEGINVHNGVNIITADKPKDFAHNIIELLENKALREKLSLAGRELVEKKYDWFAISDKLNVAWERAASKNKIPILLYHDICDDNHDTSKVMAARRPYVLRKSDFEKQMEWLRNKARFGIVFDDGWRSNYEIAYPILKHHKLRATFFVTIENVDKPDMMTWAQVKEMSDNGMEIGSHNMTHRPPIELSDEELEYEMRESKNVLDQKLGRTIDQFSSPTGFYDKRIIDIAKRIGYKKVYFSRVALNNINNGDNPAVLHKIGIKRDCDFETFRGILRGDGHILMKLRSKQVIRDWAKSILGRKIYEKAKAVVLR